MTTVSRRSAFNDNDSSVGLFAALANPERVHMKSPKKLPRSFEGLRFPIGDSPIVDCTHGSNNNTSDQRTHNTSSSQYMQQHPNVDESDEYNTCGEGELPYDPALSVHSRESRRLSLIREEDQKDEGHTLTRKNIEAFDQYGSDGHRDDDERRSPSKFSDEDVGYKFFESDMMSNHLTEPDREMESSTRSDNHPVASCYDGIRNTEDEILEKQSVLLELERLENHNGVRLTKRYTLDDNLADMQFEIRRHLSNIDEANMVKFMGDGLKLMCNGAEMANSRLGPFLELDGWAGSVTRDMGRYDSAFSKLYRKYWKRSSISPEMELAFALIGSMAMHHFQSKAQSVVFGGGMTGASVNPAGSRKREERHRGPEGMPFQEPDGAHRREKERLPSVSPSLRSIITSEEEETDDEELPPSGSPTSTVPESVPVSARKRLEFP